MHPGKSNNVRDVPEEFTPEKCILENPATQKRSMQSQTEIDQSNDSELNSDQILRSSFPTCKIRKRSKCLKPLWLRNYLNQRVKYPETDEWFKAFRGFDADFIKCMICQPMQNILLPKNNEKTWKVHMNGILHLNQMKKNQLTKRTTTMAIKI